MLVMNAGSICSAKCHEGKWIYVCPCPTMYTPTLLFKYVLSLEENIHTIMFLKGRRLVPNAMDQC
jgi:hypothetical protein